MVIKGEYMAIVSIVDAEQFIDECEQLLIRGWDFHSTAMPVKNCWIQVFTLIGDCETEPLPTASF